MQKNSFFKNALTVVGFIVVLSLLMKILGGLIGFSLHVLLPMALVVWLVRFILVGSQRHNQQNYR